MTSKDWKSKRSIKTRKIILGMSSMVAVALMLSMPFAGATTYNPPYSGAKATYSDYQNYQNLGVFNHWTYPTVNVVTGSMASETDVSFHGVGQSGAYITSTETLQFFEAFYATATRSYTMSFAWIASWHVRMAVHNSGANPCNTVGHCLIQVFMNVKEYGTGAWLGNYTVTFADYACNKQIYSVDVQGSLSTTTHAWNLVNGRTYWVWGEVVTYESLSMGSYPTYVADAWSRNDIWNNARLSTISIS